MLASLDEKVDWYIHDYLVAHPTIEDITDLINYVLSNLASSTSHPTATTQDEKALITTAAKLQPRVALPEPQNGNDCSAQASRSASEAIRQATQQASESIRKANQSASQGIQQASQSATNAIRQAENQASQTVAQAARSSSSISSSASSAILSIHSSADQAILSANNSAQTAMANASQAILQASAAVAAATGSAAAAGSSFLEQAAKATQVQGVNQAANERAANNTPIALPSPVGVSATQVAIAIVGSIVASCLITFLIYFLCQRHRKRANRAKQEAASWNFDGGMIEQKITASSVQTSNAPSHLTINNTTRIDIQRTTPAHGSNISLSLFPKTPTEASRGAVPTPDDQITTPAPVKNTLVSDKRKTTTSPVKSTSVPWNPSYPPAPPKIGSVFLSSAGAIILPVNTDTNLPLGGQLKSPLVDSEGIRIKKAWDLPLRAIPPPSASEVAKRTFLASPLPKPQSSRSKERQRQREMLREIPAYLSSPLKRQYGAAKTSVWTDDASDVESARSTVLKRRDKEMDGILRSERWADGLETPVGKREVVMSEGVRTPDTVGVIVDARALDVRRTRVSSQLRERREER